MRFVRYSLLALTVLVSSTMTTGAPAQEREHPGSPEAKSMPAQAAADQAGQYEYEYQHRLARLRRLQQIARENDNQERLERLDRLFDKLESKRHRRVDARRDRRSPEARAQGHDRLKSKHAENARQGVSERHQDRHEQWDTVVKHHRQAGVRRRENHRDAAQQRRAQHQEARQEKHHKAVKRHQKRHQQGHQTHRDASHDARHDKHGNRGKNVENHRGQARRDTAPVRYRRSLSGNRRLDSRIKDFKQNSQSPRPGYRKAASKKPALNFQSRHTFDDEIRRTITSRNANAEFERLIREIEGGP